MSFTDQKPFEVTADDLRRRWGSGFKCKLCGHEFVLGDTVRWVYANGTPGAQCGNFLVCFGCDGENVLQRGIDDFQATFKAAKRWGII